MRLVVKLVNHCENRQILGRFFANFGTFKPYNFRMAQDIANHIHYRIFVQDIVDLGAVAAMNNALLQLFEVAELQKSRLCHYLQLPSSELHQIFMGASHMRHMEFHQV